MIVVFYAHPYPHYSRACATLLEAIADLPSLQVRSLYDIYPDFDIDPDAERAVVDGAKLVVWMGPFYWYTVPALLKHWFEVVLVKGWAYGPGGTALRGKDCLWVATTGWEDETFTPPGEYGPSFETFVAPVEQTARFCGMNWLPPFTVHGAHEVRETVLREAGLKLREQLEAWAATQAGGG
jgi:glutathione-regulated potassium-efflux system ancillary protein KefF